MPVKPLASACRIWRAVELDSQPAVPRHVIEDGANLGQWHRVPPSGRPEGDPEEAKPRPCMGDALGNQRQFRPRTAWRHRKKLDPVADGAQRADKVVTDARPQKRRQVGRHRPGFGTVGSKERRKHVMRPMELRQGAR